MNKDILEEILDKARFAPSADNLQPWLFKIHDNDVHLWLDNTHLNSYCDAGFLAPYISAGAAIENIRVAATAHGYDLDICYFPMKDEPRRVADIKFIQAQTAISPHVDYLEKRHTNRNFYQKNSLIEQIVYQRLNAQIPAHEDFELKWKYQSDSDYSQIAALIGDADQLRFEIQRLHRELMQVVRFSKTETDNSKDGLSLPSLEIKGPSAWIFKFIRSWENLKKLNRIGMSRSFNLYARKQIHSSAGTALLVSKDKSPEAFVRGGEIMQRIWHEAALNQLAMQPMEALPIFIINNEITCGKDLSHQQKEKLHDMENRLYRLYEIDGSQGLIFLFRIGHAAPVSARSLRKPLADFLYYQKEKAGSPCH